LSALIIGQLRPNSLDIGLSKGIVESIEFTSPKFKTADGLSVGALSYQKKDPRIDLFKCFDNVKYRLKSGGLTFYDERTLSGGDYQNPASQSGVIHRGMTAPTDSWPNIGEKNVWVKWDGK
jgi:hypothetical protein